MGRLWGIVTRHMDAQGRYRPSKREVAKELHITPTALDGWQNPSALPKVKNLRALAALTGVPYVDVLDAALHDTGWLKPREGYLEPGVNPRRQGVALKSTGTPKASDQKRPRRARPSSTDSSES